MTLTRLTLWHAAPFSVPRSYARLRFRALRFLAGKANYFDRPALDATDNYRACRSEAPK